MCDEQNISVPEEESAFASEKTTATVVIEPQIENNRLIKPKRERYVGMDLVRVIAVVLVISVHFFYNNGFYSQTLTNDTLYIMTFMRTLFFSCVPLFMLISGYLLSKKQLSKKYYKGIGKILFVYVFAVVVCLLYNVIFLHKVTNFYDILRSFLSITNPYKSWFVGATYAWYIEMYIGLFMLVPFLNLIYNGLKSKKQKGVLVATMIALTALPSLVNGFASFADPDLSIVPDFWVSLYPITYYFIGCYIKEFQVNINKLIAAVVLFGVVLVETVSTIIYTQKFSDKLFYKDPFSAGYGGYGDFFTMTIAVLIFLICYNVKWSSKPVKLILAFLSNLTLGIYLCSWVGDQIVYPLLRTKTPVFTDWLPYYFVAVPCVFLIAMVLSFGIDLLHKLWVLIIKLIKSAFKSSAPVKQEYVLSTGEAQTLPSNDNVVDDNVVDDNVVDDNVVDENVVDTNVADISVNDETLSDEPDIQTEENVEETNNME